MILAITLLINNLGLFILEVIGYHVCHSVVMLLDGYYHLCQAILCTVRIVSRRIQFTYTPRHTYGLARVGVVGELVAFVSFLSLSVSVFLESVKHLIDVVFIIPKRESNASTLFTAHGHEHIHSLIDHPEFVLGVGIYATISNCLLGVAILYSLVKRSMELNKELRQRRQSLKTTITKEVIIKFIAHNRYITYSSLISPSAQHVTWSISYLELWNFALDVIGETSFRDVIHLVLQAKPYGLKSDEIETTVLASVPGVIRFHELHIWSLTPQKTLATVHVVFNTTEDILNKYQDINFIFRTHNIDHVTIQPEFSLSSDEMDTLGCHYQCSINSTECNPLQCCENITTDEHRSTSPSPRKIYFHRRSSVGLPSVDSDNESATEQENDFIRNTNTIVPTLAKASDSVVIVVNNEN